MDLADPDRLYGCMQPDTGSANYIQVINRRKT